jgi:hypothetical protein
MDNVVGPATASAMAGTLRREKDFLCWRRSSGGLRGMPHENAGQRPKCKPRERVATEQDQGEAALPALPDDDRDVVICPIAVNPSATFPRTLPTLLSIVKAHSFQSAHPRGSRPPERHNPFPIATLRIQISRQLLRRLSCCAFYGPRHLSRSSASGVSQRNCYRECVVNRVCHRASL